MGEEGPVGPKGEKGPTGLSVEEVKDIVRNEMSDMHACARELESGAPLSMICRKHCALSQGISMKLEFLGWRSRARIGLIRNSKNFDVANQSADPSVDDLADPRKRGKRAPVSKNLRTTKLFNGVENGNKSEMLLREPAPSIPSVVVGGERGKPMKR
uniref:Uncharacterized protein n=1 Tax=Sphaerodactylus townsendi TaxID=933632 RepID=A0ACB8FLP2_9SAUR